MSLRYTVWLLALLLLFASQSVRAANGSGGSCEERQEACREQLSSFYSLVCELRFADAQHYVDSLQRAEESDTSWYAEYVARCATSTLRYVEQRKGEELDSLEYLYEWSAHNPCGWTYGWLGLVLSYEYSRSENPAMALVYARAALRTSREQRDSALMRRAQRMVLLSSWQLGDMCTLDTLLDDAALSALRILGSREELRGAAASEKRDEWHAAEMFLDTLRGEYYSEGNRLRAGYIAQMMASLCLKEGDPRRALSLLQWADSLPTQRTKACEVFASWDLYGRCYAALGDYPRAMANYKRAEADAEGVHAELYQAEVLLHMADAYEAMGELQRAYGIKRRAVGLRDSVFNVLSIKLFHSADNLRTLQERKLLYELQLEQEQRNEAMRSRRNELNLVLLAIAIIFVEVILYRLRGGLSEKRKQRLELQSLTASLQQRSVALGEQEARLERLHAKGLKQTNRLYRIHASMRFRAAKIMQNMHYASLIQGGLLPTEQERSACFADNFLITRALQVVSGDLFWLGKREGLTIAVMVDCTGYGVSGASLSFIAYMLLNSVVRERGVVAPAEVLKEVDEALCQLMQGADTSFQGEQDIELSVLTIDPAARVVRFSGEGRQLFYSLDGRTVQCLTDKAFSLRDSAAQGVTPPTVAIPYAPGAPFYLMTDGFVQQLNADNEKLGMLRIATTIEKVLQAPMREQRQELLGLFARHRLAQDQTDDITICGMRLA